MFKERLFWSFAIFTGSLGTLNFKNLVFKCFQYSNGCYSDPHCLSKFSDVLSSVNFDYFLLTYRDAGSGYGTSVSAVAMTPMIRDV